MIALTLVASQRSGYQYQTDSTWINSSISGRWHRSPAQAGVVRVKLQDLLDDRRVVVIQAGSVSGKVVRAREILIKKERSLVLDVPAEERLVLESALLQKIIRLCWDQITVDAGCADRAEVYASVGSALGNPGNADHSLRSIDGADVGLNVHEGVVRHLLKTLDGAFVCGSGVAVGEIEKQVVAGTVGVTSAALFCRVISCPPDTMIWRDDLVSAHSLELLPAQVSRVAYRRTKETLVLLEVQKGRKSRSRRLARNGDLTDIS